jgi:PEP-CTERM motif-containing protein
MMDRIVTMLGTILILLTVVEPAMAQVQRLPEPASMSLFGLGAAGAFVAKRLIRRK